MVPKYLPILISVIVAFIATGCDDGYPHVSGQITINGQPAAGVNVMFMPVSTKENPFPGPYAEAVSNAEGRYTLVTRHGSEGATPGLNVVEFYAVDSMQIEFMRSDAMRLLTEADGDIDHPSYQKSQTLDEKAESLEETVTGDRLQPDAKTEFSVPEQGTDSADFELTELKNST